MRVIPKEKVISHFNPTNRANYQVADGEVFWVEAEDCYSGQIRSEATKRPDIDVSILDCAVGPIDVAGAEPGDTLCVEVLAIDFDTQGVMVASPGLGLLGDLIKEPVSKIIPISDGLAHFSDDIKLPLNPMIGVMGVATAKDEIHCCVPGDHGANMDTKLVRPGSRVYLPVSVKGAGLAVGDMHACMGDGELSGTGIETAGRMCLKVTVCHDKPIERPVIETSDSIYFLASRPTFEESLRIAAEDTVHFLMRKLDLDFTQAYFLLSAACDTQISEAICGSVTVRIRCPKLDNRLRSF